MMGRKRKVGERLPKYVYRKRGHYVWRRDMLGLGPPVRLCNIGAPVSAVWSAWEDLQRPDRNTIAGLLEDYIASGKRTDRTNKDYRAMAVLIAKQKLADGRCLGPVDADTPTTQFWRQYLDKLADTPTAANRRMQLIKAAYAWGYQRGRVKADTPKAVSLFSTPARDRYVTDSEYHAVLDLAQQWAADGRYPYLWIMMELAYLLRARRGEIEALERSQDQGDVLEWRRSKGSRGERTLITPRLRVAIEAGKRLDAKISSRYIVHTRGRKMNKNAFDSGWRRLWAEIMERGLVSDRFTFHDLKAKGISDHETHYSGHKSERQRGDYIRKLAEVGATR